MTDFDSYERTKEEQDFWDSMNKTMRKLENHIKCGDTICTTNPEGTNIYDRIQEVWEMEQELDRIEKYKKNRGF